MWLIHCPVSLVSGQIWDSAFLRSGGRWLCSPVKHTSPHGLGPTNPSPEFWPLTLPRISILRLKIKTQHSCWNYLFHCQGHGSPDFQLGLQSWLPLVVLPAHLWLTSQCQVFWTVRKVTRSRGPCACSTQLDLCPKQCAACSKGRPRGKFPIKLSQDA